MNGDLDMEFIKKNQHLIFVVFGILIAICGIAMTVIAVIESKKGNKLLSEDNTPAIKV